MSSMDEPTRIRKRIPKSCRRCHRRKQRCVGTPVCSNCEAANQPCLRSDRVPSWHHGMSKGALVQRIEVLEAQLAGLIDGSGSASDAGDASHRPSLSHHEVESHGPTVMNLLIQDHEQKDRSSHGHGSGDSASTSSKTEANYLGPSSGLALAESISRIVEDAVWTESIPANEKHEFPSPNDQEVVSIVPPPDDATGARLLDAYFNSMHMRLPFVCRSEIYKLHAKRHEPSGSSAEEQFAKFKIFMVYAIGAAILKMTETYDSTPPRSYFSTALQYKPSLQQSVSISSIEALMLLSMYNLQSSASSSVWYMVGLALRICVDFGLHREAQYRKMRPYEAQRRRRLFWSVYLNERSVSWSLGRPFGIADEEIDAEPPADVDDSITDDAAVEQMLSNLPSPQERAPGPNNRCFIACVGLSRISSQIRTRVYRVDRNVSTLLPEIQPLLAAMEEFKRSIPVLSPYEEAFIHMHWNNNIRMLIQPFLWVLPPDDELTRRCLSAAGQMCQYFKRLRQQHSAWYSFLLINTIFTSGLAMCLCLFRCPSLWTISILNDLRACSAGLFIMAERHPSVRKYRDALENTINRVVDHVSDSSSSSSPPQQGGLDHHSSAYRESSPTEERRVDFTPQDTERSLMDIPTPGFLIPSQAPGTPDLPTGRAFLAPFTEDFWAGDTFGLQMGEAYGLRT